MVQERAFAGWCCAGPSLGPLHGHLASQAPVFVSDSGPFLLDIPVWSSLLRTALEMPWMSRGHLCWRFFLWLSLWRSSDNPSPSLPTGSGVRTKQNPNPTVIESKSALFTTQQPDKWGDELWHRTVTLLRKPADGDKGGLESQRASRRT